MLKEAGLDCELTVQITEEYCKDITDNILPAVTAGYISLLEQQHVRLLRGELLLLQKRLHSGVRGRLRARAAHAAHRLQ